MSPDHSFDVHLSTDPSNDWRGAQTLATLGRGPNDQPLMALQTTPGGKGREVFNETLMNGVGLSMDEIRNAMAQASLANQMRGVHDTGRFMSKAVTFREEHLGQEITMMFEGFLDHGFSSRVWLGNAATFTQLPKAQAFFQFMKDNLARALVHFPEELGSVGAKLRRAGLPVPASSTPAPSLDEVVQRYDARRTVAPQPAPSTGPRGPKV